MNFIKNLFGKKDAPHKPKLLSYREFWTWFAQHEQAFMNAVKDGKNIEKEFFDPLSAKLAEIKEGFFFVAGMPNEQTAELIFTPDGVINNIVFTEELVAAAPPMSNWIFKALKPALDIDDVSIQMAGHDFHKDNMHFFFSNDPQCPDNIEITIVHDAFSEAEKDPITNGCYIFLDNFLGELNFVNMIDTLHVTGRNAVEAGIELVPIAKLKDYLQWREKEFVEKYEGTRRATDEDSYSMMQAKLKSGNILLAVINVDVLNWDAKASHPWITTVEIAYDGNANGGMPDKETMAEMELIEDEITTQLIDREGYLNIGRQTAENIREIYFACKEFRKPSRVLHGLIQERSTDLKMSYEIYKDKYWHSFDRFIQR
jgi:hypothetical protein